eukprot:1976615-Pyramimonas_sp.AAC.1
MGLGARRSPVGRWYSDLPVNRGPEVARRLRGGSQYGVGYGSSNSPPSSPPPAGGSGPTDGLVVFSAFDSAAITT